MNDEMQEILGDFLAESTEMLEVLDQHFVHLESDPTNTELLNEIFRCMHSMKGSAGFLGFTNLVEIAHHGESLLNKLRTGEIAVSNTIITIILEAVDVLKQLQADIRDSGEDSHVDTDLIVNKLALTIDSAEDQAKSFPAARPDIAAVQPVALAIATIPEPPQIPAAMKPPSTIARDQSSAEVSKTQVPGTSAPESSSMMAEDGAPIDPVGAEPIFPSTPNPNPELVPAHPPLDRTLASTPAAPPISEILAEIKEASSRTLPAANQGQQAKAQATREEDVSVRVETRRLDHVMNLVGELVLSRNRLMKLGSVLEERYENDGLVWELGGTLAQINLVASDLQLAVMKTRMVPIRKVFAKIPRLVRDLAVKLEKQVRLELSGEETEIDKSVADELGDPLVHLIRNSIDHAIESIQERQTAGKPPEGYVRLSASQEGNSIVIRLEDDGRGLQVEKIKAKALSKGLVSAGELYGMDNRDAMNLVFLPGFSTAEQVSDVSGRGVGMDVVRTNIGRMNGSIELDSIPGQGCRVTIKLPLTVAIIQALLVEVECSTFAIPLVSVLEAVKVTRDEIKTINGQTVLNLRERILPLLRLADEFGIPSMAAEEFYVVVVAVGERRLGLVVDRLRAQEEVVIKSLGEFLADVSGVAGATITGEGKVVLILDMADMIQKVGTSNASTMSMVGWSAYH